jgi:competence protein ComEC
VDAYLRYLGQKDIDVLMVTHADDDHGAGVSYVMRKFVVREVWDNGLLIYPDGFLGKVARRSLERGDTAKAYGLDIQVLHPYKGFYTFSDNDAATENNDSLVVKITGRNRSFLFTADIAEEAEEDLVHLGKWLKSDVIKVSHHGSRTSSSGDFLRTADPEIGVISVGRNNTYGHPHRETLERLREIRVYRTDRDGAVKVTETSEGFAVKTYRNFPLERTRSVGGELRNIKRLFTVW